MDIVERLRNPNYHKSSLFAQAYMNEAANELEAADKAEAILRQEIESLRSRAEKAEAELLTMTRKFNGAVGLKEQQRMRAEYAEATCEKLAKALELADGRITLLLQEFPETSDKSDHPCATKYVLKKVRGALSAYRKEASE
jgi:chromosome segregation ATPase